MRVERTSQIQATFRVGLPAWRWIGWWRGTKKDQRCSLDFWLQPGCGVSSRVENAAGEAGCTPAQEKNSAAMSHSCIPSFKVMIVHLNMEPSKEDHILAVPRYEGGFFWDTDGLTVSVHVREQSSPDARANLKTR